MRRIRHSPDEPAVGANGLAFKGGLAFLDRSHACASF